MGQRLSFRPRSFALDFLPAPAGLMALLESSSSPVWLDSAAGTPRRFSLLAWDPLRADHLPLPTDLSGLREAMTKVELGAGDCPPSVFAGGFLGALSYDLGVQGERLRLPPDPWAFAPIVGGFYVDYLVLDHVSGGATLVLGEDPGDGRASLPERRERALALLQTVPQFTEVASAGPLVRSMSASAYAPRIARLREWIGQGELYQANLAHRSTRRMRAHPLALYARVRALHPAPYQCYFAWGERASAGSGALLSASPELLLECRARQLMTRPIKGTSARGADPVSDRLAAERLLASSKDLAELAMIVDLERNDLGRVARAGSVHVVGLPTLQSYATVHHLVAEVRAELAQDKDALAALAALFPGGSITGAPKLAAMRAIGELEGEGRGFFTGSAGLLDWKGNALFNILIRTLVWRPLGEDLLGEVSLHVGGGITWDSEASAEWRETLDKGRALLAALEHEPIAPQQTGPSTPRTVPGLRNDELGCTELLGLD